MQTATKGVLQQEWITAYLIDLMGCLLALAPAQALEPAPHARSALGGSSDLDAVICDILSIWPLILGLGLCALVLCCP